MPPIVQDQSCYGYVSVHFMDTYPHCDAGWDKYVGLVYVCMCIYDTAVLWGQDLFGG